MEILGGVLACYLLTPGGISAVFFGCSRSDDLPAGEEGGRQGLVCRRSTPVNADAVSSTPVTFELFNKSIQLSFQRYELFLFLLRFRR